LPFRKKTPAEKMKARPSGAKRTLQGGGGGKGKKKPLPKKKSRPGKKRLKQNGEFLKKVERFGLKKSETAEKKTKGKTTTNCSKWEAVQETKKWKRLEKPP